MALLLTSKLEGIDIKLTLGFLVKVLLPVGNREEGTGKPLVLLKGLEVVTEDG